MGGILGIEWDDEREAIAIAMRGEPTEEEAKMINAQSKAFESGVRAAG